MDKKLIDIEKIFHSKNPKLARMMPRFVMNYLRRVMHEEEANAFIADEGDKMEFEFVRAVVEQFNLKIVAKGEEHIPAHGGFIMASNHPLGGLDALALMHVIARRRTDIRFIVNDVLLQIKNLKGLFIGVNKHGKNAAENLAEIDRLYASEQGVLIFPAGLVSRKRQGIIKDLEWKKSFITKARKHKRNVIPVHIAGDNTNRFYHLANWRKRLGIKANIEMFYLVDEMFKQKNKTITITIGEPIPYTMFDKTYSDHTWAELVKEHVYKMKGPGLVFCG